MLWLEARLRAARENPQICWGEMFLKTKGFAVWICSCLRAQRPSGRCFLRVSEVALGPGGSPWPPWVRCAGLVSHSWLRQSGLQVKASFTSANAESRSLSSFLSAADRRYVLFVPGDLHFPQRIAGNCCAFVRKRVKQRRGKERKDIKRRKR